MPPNPASRSLDSYAKTLSSFVSLHGWPYAGSVSHFAPGVEAVLKCDNARLQYRALRPARVEGRPDGTLYVGLLRARRRQTEDEGASLRLAVEAPLVQVDLFQNGVEGTQDLEVLLGQHLVIVRNLAARPEIGPAFLGVRHAPCGILRTGLKTSPLSESSAAWLISSSS